MPRIDVEISPEPTEPERAALAALVSRDANPARSEDGSAWQRAALEEAVGADDGYGSAPSL